jgi:hypothetical protein
VASWRGGPLGALARREVTSNELDTEMCPLARGNVCGCHEERRAPHARREITALPSAWLKGSQAGSVVAV